MLPSFPLLAESTTRVFLDWGRIDSKADWILPLVVVVALDVFARYMIRLDTRELPRLVGWVLTVLRIGTIACLLLIYLQPQWRSEREVVRNSRVLLLVDTSSSMGLTDVESSASGVSSRVEQVAAALDQTDFLERVRKTHDAVVLRFDEDVHRIVSLERGKGDRSLFRPKPAVHGQAAETRKRDLSPFPAADHKIDWKKALSPTGTQTRLGQALRELIHEERGSPISGIVVFSDGGQNAGISTEAAVEAAKAAKVPLFTVGLGSTRRAVGVRVYKLEVPPQAYSGDPYPVTGLIQAQGLAGRTVTVELLVRDADEGAKPSEAASGVPVRREEVVLGADGEAVPVKFVLTPTQTGRQTICLRVKAPEADPDRTDDYQEEEVEVVDRKTRVLLFASGPTREYRFLRTQLYRDASATVDVLLQTARPGISQEANQILDEFPTTREQMAGYDCLVAFDPDWQVLTPEQVDLVEGWVAEQAGGLIVIPGHVCAGESIGGWVQDPGLAKIRALYPIEFQRRLTAFESGSYVSNEPWPLDFTREGLEAEFLWLDDEDTASQQAWAAFAGVYSYFPTSGPKPGATVLARFSDPRAAQGDRQPVYFAEQFYGSGRVFYLGSGEMWRLRHLDEAHFERFYTRLIRHVSQGRLLRQSTRGVLMVGQDRYVLGGSVEIRARLTDAQFEPLVATSVALNVLHPDGSLQSVPLRPDPSRPGMFAGHLTVLSEGVYRLDLPVPDSDDERLTRRVRVRLPDLERQNPQRDDNLLSRIAQGTGGKYYQSLEAALDAGAPDALVRRLKDRTRTVIQTGALEPPTVRWLLRQYMRAPPPEDPSILWLMKSLVNDHVYPSLSRQRWFIWLVEESWLGWLLERTVLWWLMTILCSLLCGEWLIRRLSKLA